MRGYLIRRLVGSLGVVTVLGLLGAAPSLADAISATEGQPFSGVVDTPPSGCVPTNPNSVPITWGDGSSSTGTYSSGQVSGTHTYAEEGSFSGTVTVTGPNCPGGSVTDTLSASVADAALTAGPNGAVNATATQPFNGTVATFTDANPGAPASDFTATINWGDGTSSSPGTASGSGGQFAVSGSHTYATFGSGSYFISVTVNDVGGQTAFLSATATVAHAPPLFTQCPADGLDTGCQFLIVFTNSGKTVFEDPNQGPYEGAEDALIGVQNNSSQPIDAIPLSVSGSPLFGFDGDGLCNPGSGPLAPGCRVAPHEPAGTTCGPQGDACSFPPPAGEPFSYTEPGALAPNTQNGYEGPTSWFSNVSAAESSGQVNFSPPLPPGQSTYFSLEEPPSASALIVGGATEAFVPPPVLGQFFDAAPVSGIVLVKIPSKYIRSARDTGAHEAAAAGPGFVPLSENMQLPTGTQVDARHGMFKLVSATGKGSKTQSGTFNGGIFSLSQTSHGKNKGLTSLSLVEGAFKGAPTYASCSAKKAADTSGPSADAARLSSRVLQSLHSSGHGRFSTRGRFGAATVRGTAWTIGDRCDGTFISVQKDSVTVTDFVHHKTIIVRAGHSYLIKAPAGRRK